MAADGYVIVEANLDTKGFERGLAKMSSSANSAGSAVSKGLGGAVWGSVKTMGTAAVGVGAAVGTAVLGAVAYTLKKGLDRALDIQDAKATLKSLGYSVKEIETIADNTIEAVKGTPYALNDAMAIATSALASGVKEGKELTKYLQLVGDAATVAKIPMGDMGQIFNKVSATGKVTGEVVQQLSERGIPALQLLAEEYGVTAEEMQSMVRSGEVSSERFLGAIDTAFGGAALEAGNTLRGSMDNLQAAIGRAGEKFWTMNLPGVQGMFGSLTEAVDGMGPVFGILGEAISTSVAPALQEAIDGVVTFSTTFGENIELGLTPLQSLRAAILDTFGVEAAQTFDSIKGAVQGFFDGLRSVSAWVLENQDWIEPLVAGILAMVAAFTIWQGIVTIATAVQAAFNAVMAANPIGIIVLLIIGLIAALVYLWNTNDEFRAKVTEVWNAVKEKVSGVVEWFKGVPERIGRFLRGLKTKMSDAAENALEAFKSFFTLDNIAKIGKDIVRGLWNGINNMSDWIVGKIQGFGDTVLGGIKSFFGIESPSKLFEKEIGVNLALGVGSGFEKSVSKVVSGMERSLTSEMGRFSASVAPQSAVSTSQVINFNSPVQSYSETVRAMRDIERGLAF